MKSQETFSTSVFIGKTTPGQGSPVFFDPHTAVFNDRPPCTIITGGPGSGKTYFALTLTAISCLLGKTTVVLDPKGDFLSLVPLKDEIGDFVALDITQGRAGMLDPFYMASTPQHQLTLVMELIGILVGGLSADYRTALSPILRDVIAEGEPSMEKVIDQLTGSQKQAAKNLGSHLRLIANMRYSNLFFAPGNKRRSTLKIDSGLTIITLVGLDLTSDKDSDSGRLSAAIMFLVTDFLREVMRNDASLNPKLVVIDEAHEVLQSEAGRRTITSMAQLGRSKNLALVMISQNFSHFNNLDIASSISTRFAFGSSKGDAGLIIEAMNLSKDSGFEEIITDLNKGECLMSDFTGRYSTVQISSHNKKWGTAFITNPLHKMRQQAREAKAKEKEKAKQALSN